MIAAVIERLRSTAMPPLVAVDGAESLAALGEGTAPKHASAFVLPFEDRPDANDLATGFRQRVVVDLLVAIVIRRAGDAKGGGRISAVDDLRGAVETALAGWSVDDAAEPMELVVARAAPDRNGVTWYVQTWRSTRWIDA